MRLTLLDKVPRIKTANHQKTQHQWLRNMWEIYSTSLPRKDIQVKTVRYFLPVIVKRLKINDF